MNKITFKFASYPFGKILALRHEPYAQEHRIEYALWALFLIVGASMAKVQNFFGPGRLVR
jgi:hypothetical protein